MRHCGDHDERELRVFSPQSETEVAWKRSLFAPRKTPMPMSCGSPVVVVVVVVVLAVVVGGEHKLFEKL
jgi:hypothetical protein